MLPLAHAHRLAAANRTPVAPDRYLGQLGAQRHCVPVRVPMQLLGHPRHVAGEFGDQLGRRRIRVLVGVQPHRHIQLRRAVGAATAQILAQWQLIKGDLGAWHTHSPNLALTAWP